jgi:hypothetical protein
MSMIAECGDEVNGTRFVVVAVLYFVAFLLLLLLASYIPVWHIISVVVRPPNYPHPSYDKAILSIKP